MSSVRVMGLGGRPAEVAETDLAALEDGLQGSLVRPGDAAYDEVTTIWNGMITKRPALVIRPIGAADVVRAVGFARDQGLEMSIKGGGHNIAGLSMSDGGITLDMSRMSEIRVNREGLTVAVGPGCRLGDVDRATQEHGLATTLGFVSLTGAAGLTLGGGFGYLTRRFGWTVDDLLEVEIVTADGVVRRASRNENEDLFWALRGGGGNFGVVTEFVYRLHHVGPMITGGLIAWPAGEAGAVLELYRELTDSAPLELTAAVLLRFAPPAPWLPEEAHGTPIVALVVCHSGSPEEAAADLAPIRSHGEPLADLIEVKEYVAQQSMLDATQPNGMHYYWKSEFVAGLSDELLRSFETHFVESASTAHQIVLFHLAGALNEHPEDDGAMGNRQAAFACVIQGMWPDGASDADANRDWVRDAWSALRPFSTGGNYINFQTAEEADDRTAESYGENHRRLEEVKAAYDPTNLFRVNRNIRPRSG